jgi:hypothetical protein
MYTRPVSALPRQVSRFRSPPARWRMVAPSLPSSKIRTATVTNWSSAPNEQLYPPRLLNGVRHSGEGTARVRASARPAGNGGRLSR